MNPALLIVLVLAGLFATYFLADSMVKEAAREQSAPPIPAKYRLPVLALTVSIAAYALSESLAFSMREDATQVAIIIGLIVGLVLSLILKFRDKAENLRARVWTGVSAVALVLLCSGLFLFFQGRIPSGWLLKQLVYAGAMALAVVLCVCSAEKSSEYLWFVVMPAMLSNDEWLQRICLVSALTEGVSFAYRNMYGKPTS